MTNDDAQLTAAAQVIANGFAQQRHDSAILHDAYAKDSAHKPQFAAQSLLDMDQVSAQMNECVN